MYCRYCGNEISDNAKFCTECGKKVHESVSTPTAEQKAAPVPVAKNTCPLCGGYFSRKEGRCRRCGATLDQVENMLPDDSDKTIMNFLKIIGIVIVVLIFLALSAAYGEGAEAPEPNPPKSTAATTEPISSEEIFVQEFQQTAPLKEDVIRGIYAFLADDLGFENIVFGKENKKQEIILSIAWNIWADEYHLIVSADDDGIHRIIASDIMTMYEDGEIIATKADLGNRIVKTSTKGYCVSIAKSIVLDSLKSPSSAEFCPNSEMDVLRDKGFYSVSGWVDASNSFGAIIREDFTVQFVSDDPKSGYYTLTYIKIGDSESGEFINLE